MVGVSVSTLNKTFSLKRQYHEMYIFLRTITFIYLKFTLCLWADSFHCLLRWIYLLILKILGETFLIIPFSIIGRFSQMAIAHPSLDAMNLLQCTRYARLSERFFEPWAAFCKPFHGQNRRIRASLSTYRVTRRFFEAY